MNKLTKVNYEVTNGTSHHSLIVQSSLENLLDEFGQPSYVGSGDNKTQLTWVYYNSPKQVITIYDSKESLPITQIKEWHVGSKGLNENEIIEFFESYNINLAKQMIEGFYFYNKKII